MRRLSCIFPGVVALAVLISPGTVGAQHGVILSGGGPIQRSMGGTATANPLDTFGALYWNPATLSALEQNELTFSGEVLMARSRLQSILPANSFGRGVPGATLSGSTDSDSGSMILPNVALTHHIEDSCVTLGFGVISAAGFSANYPASFTNPILTPPAPAGLGLGRAFAELQVLQIVPSMSVRVTDRFSVGFSPIVNFASLKANPLLLSPPDDANGDTFFTYHNGTHTNWHWGAGFQIGAYYEGPQGWNFGASFKSPQWFETFRFNSVDERGFPRVDTARFDLPWIGSVGLSYTGFADWVFAADLRYVDYRNAEGFGDSGFLPTGAVRGLGWDSQIVVALGAQYRVSDRLTVRGGYSYNDNPQEGDVAFFNVASPTIIEHTAYTGATWKCTEALLFSLAYVHAFQNEVEGPITLAAGAIPGSLARSTVSADAVVMGFTVKY